MKKEKFTNEQFEKDSLAVFEKLLQGYSKAMQSAAWSRRPNELIEKLTQLPTALFERNLFELFDDRYVIASEDIEKLIDCSLQLRSQMEETQRFVYIKTRYFKLPFTSNQLKSFKVYNHEYELCYKQTYSLKINWTKAIRCFLKKKRNELKPD